MGNIPTRLVKQCMGWADHIAIQGLSNMLNVSFSIVSSQYSNVTEVNPSSGDDNGTIHLGLLGQFHYVGLHKVCEQSVDNDVLIDNENIHDGEKNV